MGSRSIVIRNRNNLILGIIFLVIGLFIFLTIPSQIKRPDFTEMGPRFFPRFLSVLLMTMSLLLIGNGFFGKAAEEEIEPIVLRTEWSPFLILALTVAWVYLMPLLGFLVATPIFSLLIMFLLGVRRWYFHLGLLAFVFVVFYVFERLMYVQLP